MNLSGKTVLITGSGIRLGRVMALAIANAGGDVVLHYHSSREPAKNLQVEIEKLGRKAYLFQAKEDLKPVLQCALDSEQLRPHVEKIFTLNQEVNILRLTFLDLPKNQRDKLLKEQGSRLKGIVIKKVLKERSQAIEAKSISLVDITTL